MSIHRSIYYRAPEGQDIVGKLAYASKVSGASALAVGLVDAQVYTKTKGYLGALGRIGYWALPALGVSSAFVCTTYIATNVRGKDDALNYALGGAAAGSVIGAFRRSLSSGFVMGAILALCAVAKKELNDQNMLMFPTTNPVQRRTVSAPLFDFTLSEELPGNWTSEAPNTK